MSGFIEGEDRHQATLFPERLDDYIAEDSPVRVIDVFIDELDVSGLGFKTVAEITGRPGYHPTTLLKLYIYGYLNRIQSSRRLEREAQRNVELMWLTGRLAPDFKIIADFRKDNGEAIRLVCREFVVLCRKLELFTDAFVAIDGSKFKAVNNRDRNFTKAKLKRRLLESPDQQISLTDPDARSMATSGRGTGMVGYNVQAAVDAKHHLIVAHEVTNVGHDRNQLSHMAKTARQAIGTEALEVVADRGYFKGEEIHACDEANITTYLPKPQTSGNMAKGFFGKRDFIYKPEDDEYECPAGERAIYRSSREENGKLIRRYWSSACVSCTIKSQCTTGKERRISRWEHEAVIEAAERRLDKEPERMRIRRSTVEHPFGTLKAWMGYSHFLTRTLPRVSTEMSLHVLAYNLKRLIAIKGVRPLIAAMQA